MSRWAQVPQAMLTRAARPARRKLRQRENARRQRRAWELGEGKIPIFDPPDTPRGWVTGPPDFVGVGCQRCGTSWWCGNLFAHPGVSRARGALKEWHYFERFRGKAFTDADSLAYQQYFPRRPGTIAWEWTPGYMVFRDQIAHLYEAAPAAKILVLVRDPVERHWSALHFGAWWAERTGVSLTEAESHMQLTARAAYKEGLDDVIAAFDRSQLLLLQYERCRVDTEGSLRRTYEFLGLDPDFRPPRIAELRAQAVGVPKPEMPAATRAELVEFYRPSVQLLVAKWPEIDLTVWPNFADLA